MLYRIPPGLQELHTGLIPITSFRADKQLEKSSPLVHELKIWVDQQYEDGRVTVMTDNELVAKIGEVCDQLNISLYALTKYMYNEP